MKLSTKVTTIVILLPLLLFMTSILYFSIKLNDIKLLHQSDRISLDNEIEDKSMEINLLEGKINELDETIMALEKKIESNIRDQYPYNAMISQNNMNLTNHQKIIDNLPQLTKKLAFVNHESFNDTGINLTLDYVQWFSDVEAERAAKEDNNENAASLNNNFYIRNDQIENDEVRINSDTLIYVLEGAAVKFADFNSFLNKTNSLKDRLVHVYSIDEKILILEEQYRP